MKDINLSLLLSKVLIISFVFWIFAGFCQLFLGVSTILLSSGGIDGHVMRVQRRNIYVKWSRVVLVWDENDMDESRVEYNMDE